MVEITYVGAKIAADRLEDATTKIACGFKGLYNFRSKHPDLYTKVLTRQIMKQLWENWRIRGVGHGAYQGVDVGAADQQWVSHHQSCG